MMDNLLNLGLDGIVEIPQCGLYAKTPESLKNLFVKLKELGYEIKDCTKDELGHDKSEQIKEHCSYSWYITLSDDVAQPKGKCSYCGSYISLKGIRTHKHKCEACGKYTYLEFVRGSEISFCFVNDLSQERRCRSKIKMKIFGYDKKLKSLLLYATPLDNNRGLFDVSSDDAKSILKANSSQFRYLKPGFSKGIKRHIRKLKATGKYTEADAFRLSKPNRPIGVPLIAIPYDPCSPYVGVIDTYEMTGHVTNYRSVKICKGREYSEWESLPMPESYSVYEAWHWAPLKPSKGLHERIIHSAGMVTDCGYYYQDGRTAFFDIHLYRMRLFVDNLTTLNIDKWDLMMKTADKSGPGMIKAIAAFCQGVEKEKAMVEDKPNIGNLLIGFNKFSSGEKLVEAESVALGKATADETTFNQFMRIFD